MAFFLTKSQQLRVGAVTPIPAYSRVVSLHQVLPADDVWYVAVSPTIGNRVWLLGIDIWATPIIPNDNNYSAFTFRIGTGISWTIAEVNQWEEILPITTGAVTRFRWQIYDGCDHHHWNISKIYTGQSRRLAVTSMRAAGMGVAELDVSFEISEG